MTSNTVLLCWNGEVLMMLHTVKWENRGHCEHPRSGSSTYYSHLYSILDWMGEVTEQEKGMVFCQASDVRKIPQLVADILHRYSLHIHRNTHTLISINMTGRLEERNIIRKRCDSLLVLCLWWKQVLCGHSCCPNARCLAGTWWSFVEVAVQPWRKHPTDGMVGRSRWGSCALSTRDRPDRTAVSGPGSTAGAGRDDDHTAPGATKSRQLPSCFPTKLFFLLL